MVLEKLKKIKFREEKPEEEEEKGEEFVEIDEKAVGGDQKINVRIETLKDFIDTDRIQQMVREGTIVFLKIKELRQKDVSELKRSVEKLKKTCTAMNGDIVGIDEDFLVITPPYAMIYRGKPA